MQATPNRFEYEVGYTCGGCSKAVDRILGKLKDVNGFQAWHVPDWEQKRAYAWFDSGEDTAAVQAEIDAKLQKWSDASQKPFKFLSVAAAEVDAEAKKPE